MMPADVAGLRIVLCDDRPLLLEAMAQFLRHQPNVNEVRTAHDGVTALQQARAGADVILLNAGHTGAISLVAIVDALKDDVTRLPVLIISADPNHVELIRAVINVSAGAIDTNSGRVELMSAIEQVARGQTVVTHDVAVAMLRFVRTEQAQREAQQYLSDRLTARELTIVRLVADGLGRPALADKLGLSPHTMRTHLGNIMTKLDVHSQLELAATARRYAAFLHVDSS